MKQLNQKPSLALRVLLTVVDVGLGGFLTVSVLVMTYFVLVLTGGPKAVKESGHAITTLLGIGSSLLFAGAFQWMQRWKVIAYGLGTGAWLILWYWFVLLALVQGKFYDSLGDAFGHMVAVSVMLIVHSVALCRAVKETFHRNITTG
jgi:hypothetical protein